MKTVHRTLYSLTNGLNLYTLLPYHQQPSQPPPTHKLQCYTPPLSILTCSFNLFITMFCHTLHSWLNIGRDSFKGCDSNFDEKCTNFKSCYKWNIYLAFNKNYNNTDQQFKIWFSMTISILNPHARLTINAISCF